MDVTPKAFRDVQFREKLRGGYHPEDVDEFLEQAALGLEVMLERLQQATERAERAEQAASEANASDEALKRMLLLAQRTVDQAVKEAQDDADQLLSESRAQSEALLAEARAESEALIAGSRAQYEALVGESQAKADALLADAEERGRAAYEGHLAEGRASVEKASTALQQAQQESWALRSWVDEHRAHLLQVLGDAVALVESAGLLSEPPPVSALDTSDLQTGPVPEIPTAPGMFEAAEFETAEVEAPQVEAPEIEAPEIEAAEVDEVDLVLPSPYDDEQSEPLTIEDPQAREPLPAPPAGPVDEMQEDGQNTTEQEDGPVVDAGTVVLDDGPTARPVDDEQPLGFDERALDSFFSEQDLGDQRSTGRFRRRQ